MASFGRQEQRVPTLSGPTGGPYETVSGTTEAMKRNGKLNKAIPNWARRESNPHDLSIRGF